MNGNRRRVLAGFAGSLLPVGWANSAQQTADVIIVGAGLAGLNAALTLQNAGASTQVLEAADRTGGRVRNVDLPTGPANAGATTIGPYYARIRNLATSLDVALEDPWPRGAMGNFVNGTLVAGGDWSESPANQTKDKERAVQPAHLEFRFVGANNPLNELTDWLKPELIAKLDVPYVDYLQSLTLSPEAIRLIDISANITGVRTASALGQLRDLHRIAWGLGQADDSKRSVYDPPKGRSHYVTGGTQKLTDAMMSALENRPRLNTPVTAIEQDKRGVTVTTWSGERLRANHAVLAVPPTALKNIEFSPRLAARHYDAVFSTVASSTAHYWFAVKQPFWENDIGEPALFCDNGLERIFAHKDPSTGDISYLDCWINGLTAQQLDQLSPREAVDWVSGKLAEARPASEGKLEFLDHFSWGRHPYIHGHRHEYGIGQIARFGNAFNEAFGRVFFAGEHCRVLEAGMEAAAASGERAALAALGMPIPDFAG